MPEAGDGARRGAGPDVGRAVVDGVVGAGDEGPAPEGHRGGGRYRGARERPGRDRGDARPGDVDGGDPERRRGRRSPVEVAPARDGDRGRPHLDVARVGEGVVDAPLEREPVPRHRGSGREGRARPGLVGDGRHRGGGDVGGDDVEAHGRGPREVRPHALDRGSGPSHLDVVFAGYELEICARHRRGLAECRNDLGSQGRAREVEGRIVGERDL